MRINHRRFQVFTRPPETSESIRLEREKILHYSECQKGNNITVQLIYLLTVSIIYSCSTYLLRKQAATAAAEDVNRREEADRETTGRERGRRKKILLVTQTKGLAMQRKPIRNLV